VRVGRHLDPGLEGRSDPGRRELRHRCVAVGHVVARGRAHRHPDTEPVPECVPEPVAEPDGIRDAHPDGEADPDDETDAVADGEAAHDPRPRRLGPQGPAAAETPQ
jgi:hypothetical protein